MNNISYNELIRKLILIGLTYYTSDNTFIEQKQYYGTVIKASQKGIKVLKKDGTTLNLPPDLSPIEIAEPGEYRLRSTGESVFYPDYLVQWIVTREEQDAYIVGIDKPVNKFEGVVIAVIHRNNDVEEKWVVAPEGSPFTKEEIDSAVHFQEQYFDSDIIMA